MQQYGKNNLINRQQWVEQALKSLPNGETILDVGAGECQYKQYCKHLEYTSQDVAEYDGKGDSKGLQTEEWDTSKIDIVCDIVDFPKDLGPYDNLVCTEVLEHVSDPVKAFDTMCSLVKEGGSLIFTAPFASLTHFAPYHYATGFNRYFYEFHLKKNGFSIEEITANGNYFQTIAQELYRISSMLSEHHSKYVRAAIHYGLIKPIIKVIESLDKKTDSSFSENLSCYGYHIRAKKIK